MAMPPDTRASRAAIISSRGVAVRKPKPPRFTPRIGTPQIAHGAGHGEQSAVSAQDDEQIGMAGKIRLRTAATLARGTRAAVSLSSAREAPRTATEEAAQRRGSLTASGLAARPTRVMPGTSILLSMSVSRSPAVRPASTGAGRIPDCPWGRARARGDPEDVPATKDGVACHASHDRAVLGGLADHPTLAHGAAPDLELGLDQGHRLPAEARTPKTAGRTFSREMKATSTTASDRRVVEEPGVEGARVGLLHHDDSLVGAEA